jgi:hypothetical protein
MINKKRKENKLIFLLRLQPCCFFKLPFSGSWVDV